jgi:peptide subunit release factor 1 (eRF1)
MTFTRPSSKPRNPLVAAAHRRLAGAHRRSNGGQRQQSQQALRRELRHEHPPSP